MTSLLLRAPCPLTERTNTEVMRAASVAARVPLAAPRATRWTRASPTRTHTTSRSVSEGMEPALFVGADRAAKYGGNHAQYLLDLDANTATTFNFCGGMMFGVSLSPLFSTDTMNLLKPATTPSVAIRENTPRGGTNGGGTSGRHSPNGDGPASAADAEDVSPRDTSVMMCRVCEGQ